MSIRLSDEDEKNALIRVFNDFYIKRLSIERYKVFKIYKMNNNSRNLIRPDFQQKFIHFL